MGILGLKTESKASQLRKTWQFLLGTALLSACGSNATSDPELNFPPGAPSAFVVTGDFETGSYAVLPTENPADVAPDLGGIHGDAVARAYQGQVFVINRFGADNIQKIDPARGWTTTFQCSVGNGSNPHDMAFVSPTKAYVTRYEETSIAIVDPSVGADCAGFRIGEIDLSAFADSDGIPEMDQMVLIDDRLFVSLQRLNRNRFFEPDDESLLVVIDTNTDLPLDTRPDTAKVDPIVLTWTNPLGASRGLPLDPATGDILVAQVGSFAVIGDGGVETINPRTFARSRILITESDLGRNITDFVQVDGRNAWVLVTDENFRNFVVQIDTTLREEIRTIFESDAFLTDIEFSPRENSIWLSDRSLKNAGLRIFSALDGAGIEAPPISTGLPPVDILFLTPASEG
ncbi:MAG: hypothetical protein H8E96_05660 [Verrucomicrobiaceae bacterium]|nr:hypothetical protein [Verrucomicrobiaceae bacterium]